MKTITNNLLKILFLFVFTVSTFATTYYVDYDEGNDSNNGLSEGTAWKHAPGDPLAVNNPSTVVLNPGDIVLFKGGVTYRGSITLKYSGSADAPIVYRGNDWGDEKAIIDGTDLLPGEWQACQSANDAGGNPDWQNIYFKTFTGAISPFTQIFENGQRAYISQTPNMSDPFWDDETGDYLPVTPENITRTSITDTAFLSQPDSNYWNGGYIQVWVNPNIIEIRKITSFSPARNSVYYDSLPDNSIYGDRVQYYSIVNHLSAMDRPGEYVVDETNKNIFYWPYGEINTCDLSISTRSRGIGTNNTSHIQIEGFKIQGFTDDNSARAIWNNKYWGALSHDVTISNNEITHIRSKNGRTGSISAGNIDGVVIENNYIHHCQRNSGIVVGGPNIVIQNNRINKVGYKGIWTMGASILQILHNTVDECDGTHGNPVSVFTTANSLIADNQLYSGGEVFTFERDSNIVLHNNIIFGGVENGAETGSNLIRQNGSITFICHGYTIITNNTLLYSGSNSGIAITQYFDDLGKVIIKNNITDGAVGGTTSMSMLFSHNIYTGLGWSQKERYGWSLREGEVVITNLDTIFINPSTNDFRLLENSPARDSGIDLDTIIPQEIRELFPDYDFTKDYAGNTRGLDGKWDIGAYEYVSDTPDIIDILSDKVSDFMLLQNYPNPFNQTTTIGYSIPSNSSMQLTGEGLVTIKVYDIMGKEVATLVNEKQHAGNYTVQFNAAKYGCNPGIYFYQIKTGQFLERKKFILLR